MANIMRQMTITKAWQLLEKRNLTTTPLLQVKHLVMAKQSRLRQRAASPSPPIQGSSSVENARIMLNGMIYESLKKYDSEKADCTTTFAHDCKHMEDLSSQITVANSQGANARATVMKCQERIRSSKTGIFWTHLQRKQHLDESKTELARMRHHKAVLSGDIAIMSRILNITQCKATSLMQTEKLSLLRCHDPCTKKSFLTFSNDEVQQKLSQLQSPASKTLVHDTFQHAFDGAESSEPVSFLQSRSHRKSSTPSGGAQAPESPCNDPNGVAGPIDKKKLSCKLEGGDCLKLQMKFEDIQSALDDEKNELQESITAFEKYRDETKDTLEAQIQNYERVRDDAQTCQASGTAIINSAEEESRQTAKEHLELTSEVSSLQKSCSENYENYENELCALKKIRGELYKMEAGGLSPTFQDCDVGDWVPGDCSVDCGGGVQTLNRAILTPAIGGAKCLPTSEERNCNTQACPIDCKMASWGGWSQCTAECGSGVQQRMRFIERAAKYGGDSCGLTSDSQSCHNEGCDQDCQLGSWTLWDQCSKDCGGGTNKRMKYVIKPAQGEGKCPGEWDETRIQYKACHTHECAPKLTCAKELDIVLVLDGSGSMGKKGWDDELLAAKNFIDAFQGGKAKFSVVVFSGPFSREGADYCVQGKVKGEGGMENYCQIKSILPMETAESSDVNAVKAAVSDLSDKWPRGTTLTSLALLRAKAELETGGRQDAESVVVVFTDGNPHSWWKTYLASRRVRKSARLVWVPIVKWISKTSLRKMRWSATRRWQENVVTVKDFEDLATQDTADRIVADICPQTYPHDPQPEGREVE